MSRGHGQGAVSPAFFCCGDGYHDLTRPNISNITNAIFNKCFSSVDP